MAWTVDLSGRAVHARNIEIIDVKQVHEEYSKFHVAATTTGGDVCILATKSSREEASRTAERIAKALFGEKVSPEPRGFEVAEPEEEPDGPGNP
jgi:hypothetical protein